MVSVALSWLLLTGWLLSLRIQRTIIIWVRAPRRSFAHKAGGICDLCDNFNSAAKSCWRRDQDALRISAVSEMYPTGVICLFWAQDSSWVTCQFWLPCHIYNIWWTLAFLCNFVSSGTFFISQLFCVFVVSICGSVCAKIQLLARANFRTMNFLRRVSPVVFDCLQPITSLAREELASTLTPWGKVENISHTTFERLAYFQCFCSSWRHLLVMSGIQISLLIFIGSEW